MGRISGFNEVTAVVFSCTPAILSAVAVAVCCLSRNSTWSMTMRAYLLTTGTLFGILTVAHIWRVIAESRALATEPWYVAITIVSAALCVWAFRLVRLAPRTK